MVGNITFLMIFAFFSYPSLLKLWINCSFNVYNICVRGSGRVAPDMSDICYINIDELTGRGPTVGVGAAQGCLVRTCSRVVFLADS